MKPRHTHLTVLTPIAGATPTESRARMDNLANLFRGATWSDINERVFGRSHMVHMARFQIIDRMTPAMGARTQDRTTAKYLLFAAELDGFGDDFYDHLYRFDDAFEIGRDSDGGFVRRVWGNCSEFPAPESKGEVYFRRYMRRFEIPAGIVYAGANASVRQILEALLVQCLWREFPRTDGAPMAASDAWRALKKVLRELPSLPTDRLIELVDRLNGDVTPTGAAPLHFQGAIAFIDEMLVATTMAYR